MVEFKDLIALPVQTPRAYIGRLWRMEIPEKIG